MERVNFPYQSAYDEGYRHAIMDAVNWLEGHSESAHRTEGAAWKKKSEI